MDFELNLLEPTNVFWRNAELRTRYVFNPGGTRSSKTYSLCQLMYVIAAKNEGKIISIVSETLPHLKKGAMRDFFSWLVAANLYEPKNHNKTDNIYTVGKSIIEFFSVDDLGKVHGPGRDYLYCNEIQNIKYETFFHLSARTSTRVYSDYNPTSYFWADTEYIENPEMDGRVSVVRSTFKDNQYCPEEIIKDILARAAKDENYKRVYIDGLPGVAEGLIFETFKVVNSIPEGARFIGYGLDFGFTNDPTALIAVYSNGGELYFDELIYEYGLTNADINQLAISQGVNVRNETTADSAEPKSIEELARMKWNITGATKGEDSIRNGIDILKRYALNVTARSVGLIKELRNYKWAIDRDGKPLNKPIDIFNHSIDACRYVALSKLQVSAPPAKPQKQFKGIQRPSTW
jgi:phage terminase large subunit